MYRTALLKGDQPTALAISVLDLVGLSNWGDEDFQPDPKFQWIFTHYLLDGHHKIRAASMHKHEIRLLSLLRLGQGSGHVKFSDDLYRILDR